MSKDGHSPSNPPFWVEAPQAQYQIPQQRSFTIRLIYFVIIVGLIVLLLEFVVGVYSFTPSPFNIICGGYLLTIVLVSFVPRYFIQKRKNADNLKAMDIQNKAKQESGASIMGSAMHAAGHPSLERDQPIVLALTEGGLDFYAFDKATPIASTPLRDITAVKTVVYDDERVPHAEVIDSAAQALQIEFMFKDQACSMLFKSMKEIRPIDWYHAIQQVRLN